MNTITIEQNVALMVMINHAREAIDADIKAIRTDTPFGPVAKQLTAEQAAGNRAARALRGIWAALAVTYNPDTRVHRIPAGIEEYLHRPYSYDDGAAWYDAAFPEKPWEKQDKKYRELIIDLMITLDLKIIIGHDVRVEGGVRMRPCD